MVTSSEFIRGYTEMIILAILFENDDYSYNISNRISAESDGILTITNPSLVITLKKMCEEGKVSSYNVLNERNVNRKFYSITDYGKSFYLDNVDDYLSSLDKINQLMRRKS